MQRSESLPRSVTQLIGGVPAVLFRARVRHVHRAAHRSDRRAGAAHGVRDVHRVGDARGVASQSRAPILRHHPLEPRPRRAGRGESGDRWLVPARAPLVVAVDDTLFRRGGRKVYAACWAYDGSRQVAKGQQKLSRGNTFVVAAIVVEVPFLDRPIALPVLARLWRPTGPTKTTTDAPTLWPCTNGVACGTACSAPDQSA